MRTLVLIAIATACSSGALAQTASRFFRIQVIDRQTKRGVPLVELSTVNNIRLVTDSRGLVAFDEPGFMDQRVYFGVKSHGYRHPKDAFGYEGVALDVKPGGRATIEVDRTNIAERLYRITGQGIYRDTILLGEAPPVQKAGFSAGVVGQDSAQVVPYLGHLVWVWGDTNLARYPLGVFQSVGATAPLPGPGGTDPEVGIDLKYYVAEDGNARGLCEREGPNPIWIEGLLTLKDANGAERMVARYTRMKDLGTMLEHGLVQWDDRSERFAKTKRFDVADQLRCPRGHPARYRDGDTEYFLFPTPFATMRVRADVASLSDPQAYEAFTCLAPGTHYSKEAARVERAADGSLVYAWKKATEPVTQAQEAELLASGAVRAGEARFQVRDAATGKPVVLHNGSLNWNAYRKAWLIIATEVGGGPSHLGEIWLAEAQSPTGPWTTATRIATHDRYTFYNPVHHAFLDREGGRIVYFEGTYTNSFSGNPDQTARYDYNQVMYRLDLADPRLLKASR